MKKRLALVLLMVISLSNCSKNDGILGDVSPVNILIYVQDVDGNDLLSSQFSGNILEDEIYITYDNLEYPLGVDMSEETITRAYFSVLSGLKLGNYENDNYLIFGEFEGTEDWNDSFEIHWGDGSSDKISFTSDFEWDNEGLPKISNSAVYYNDIKVEDKLVIIK